MISSTPEAKKRYIGLNFGDVVSFEGRNFELRPASNSNVHLKEVVVDGDFDEGKDFEWVAA